MLNTPGLEITVRGQYYCNAERGKVLKIYKNEIFHLPETMVIQVGFENYVKMVDGRRVKRARPKKEKVSTRVWLVHIIRRLCLPARLKEKYEDFEAVRTCIIENVKRVTELPKSDGAILDPKKIKSMSLSELQRFTVLEGISIPIESFPDIDDARQAVQDEYDSVRAAEEKHAARTETAPVAPLGEETDPGAREPDETTLGPDEVPTDHYTDPSLKPESPDAAPVNNDLLD